MKRIENTDTGAQRVEEQDQQHQADAGGDQQGSTDEAGSDEPAPEGEVEGEGEKHSTDEALANPNATEALAEAAGATPPKKGRFDFDPTKVASSRKGTKVRTNVFYEVVSVPSDKIKMQPQKALCLQLVNANTSDDEPRISEPELKAIVEAAKADGTLETRQDAWRIFAYYKGQLVEEGYLKEYNMSPKVAAKKAS